MTIGQASGIKSRTYLQWIDGNVSDAASGERFTLSSPAHDVVVGDYPLAHVIDTDAPSLPHGRPR